MITSGNAVRPDVSRRRFLTSAAGGLVAASGVARASVPQGAQVAGAPDAPPRAVDRRVKVGLVGCGGRGGKIAKLMMEFGGYELVAVADYFQGRADMSGDAHGALGLCRMRGQALPERRKPYPLRAPET